MQGLLVKDFLANKTAFKHFGMVVGFFALIGIIGSLREGYNPENLPFLGCFFPTAVFIGGGEALSSTILRRDESKRWAYFISSSPVGTKGQVDSKYLFLMAMTFAFTLIALIFDSILVTLHKEYISMAGMIYIISVIQLFLRAIDTPFILRWGYDKGIMVKTCFLLALIFAVIVYMLFGDLSVFGSLDDLWAKLAKTFEEPTVFLTKLLGGMGLVSIVSFCVSYRISCKIYPKGVECIGE